MSSMFRDMYSNGILLYLDDIVIYDTVLETHKLKVKEVMERLKHAGLRLNKAKCHFNKEKIKYLGYIVSSKGQSMDPDKVKVVKDWPIPRNAKQIQRFIGFVKFYRSLIPNFSSLTEPLTKFTRKDVVFQWTEVEDKAFIALKQAFCEAVMLRHPDEKRPFFLETDASNVGLGAIVYQDAESGKRHSVAFVSRQLLPAERNYEVYDKELLAIVDSWRHFLSGQNIRSRCIVTIRI